MVTFQAKVKINDVIYTIDWDATEKISIPEGLDDAITSPELISLMQIMRTLRLWMNELTKQEIRMMRTE